MPNIPTTLSIRSYETVYSYFKENDLDRGKIKCFFSMVDHRKNLHHEVMNEFYKDKFFLKSYIPYLSDVEKMVCMLHHLKPMLPAVMQQSVIVAYGKKSEKPVLNKTLRNLCVLLFSAVVVLINL